MFEVKTHSADHFHESFSRPAHVQEFVKVKGAVGGGASGERANGEQLQERLNYKAHEEV